ncbi:hypothetical protein AB1I63_07100 [Streptococcus pneumoniae]
MKSLVRSCKMLSLALLSLSLTACAQKVPDEYDFGISHSSVFTTFKEKEGGFDTQDYQLEKEVYFNNDYLLKYGNSYLTQEDGKMSTRVQINLDTLSLESKSSLPYCRTWVTDGRYIYGIIEGSSVEFRKYDQKLEQVEQKTIVDDEYANSISSMTFIGDQLYALVNRRLLADESLGTQSHQIWKISRDLEIEEKIDLGNEIGGYMSLAALGDTLYVAETVVGKDESGEYIGGKHIFTYNTKTRHEGKIDLELPYPYRLLADESGKKLLIQHDQTYLNAHTWTVLDVANEEQEVLAFPKGESSYRAFSAVHKGHYYFGLDKKLVIYDPVKHSHTDYDLTTYGIEGSYSLFFKE